MTPCKGKGVAKSRWSQSREIYRSVGKISEKFEVNISVICQTQRKGANFVIDRKKFVLLFIVYGLVVDNGWIKISSNNQKVKLLIHQMARSKR